MTHPPLIIFFPICNSALEVRQVLLRNMNGLDIVFDNNVHIAILGVVCHGAQFFIVVVTETTCSDNIRRVHAEC